MRLTKMDQWSFPVNAPGVNSRPVRPRKKLANAAPKSRGQLTPFLGTEAAAGLLPTDQVHSAGYFFETNFCLEGPSAICADHCGAAVTIE
jgi:hypothetical protein